MSLLLLFSGDGPSAITGTLVATEVQDTAAFTGSAAFAGTLAATETQDAATLSGAVSADGSLTATETQDAVSLAGEVTWPAVTGSFAATEIQDIATIDATLAFAGVAAANEGTQDNVEVQGGLAAAGSLDGSENGDLASFAAVQAAAGELIVEELSDQASINVSGAIAGTIAPVENQDTVAFSEGASSSGDLTAIENVDVAVFSGTLVEAPSQMPVSGGGAFSAPKPKQRQVIFGNLSVIEAQDQVVAIGAIVALGDLQVRENADGFQAEANSIVFGSFGAAEVPDIASMNGAVNDWIAYDEDFMLLAA